MNTPYNKCMENIYELMKTEGLTMYALAKKSNVAYSVVKEMLSGKKKIENLSGKTIRALSKTLNISMEEFMDLDLTERYPSHEDYETKALYYTDILKGRKNVILCRESACEYHNLTDESNADDIYVYACTDLPYPYVVTKVNDFSGIDYEVLNGIMVTTKNQTISDMKADR